MKLLSTTVLIFIVTVIVCGCSRISKEEQSEEFIAAHVEKIKPIIRETNLAYWKAANTGNPEDYDKVSELEFEIRKIYSNSEEFEFLKERFHFELARYPWDKLHAL